MKTIRKWPYVCLHHIREEWSEAGFYQSVSDKDIQELWYRATIDGLWYYSGFTQKHRGSINTNNSD